MAMFEPKPWVNPFGKIGVFFVLEYRKRNFLSLYCVKNKVGKMAFFGPKPWANPFWKNVNFMIFLTFWFL